MIEFLKRLAARIKAKRRPDFYIGGEVNPYIRRWWVIPRNKVFNIYLHEVVSSDSDEALHDHPWANCSMIIDGAYDEHTIEAGGVHRRVRRGTGSIVFRRATAAHRLEVIPGITATTIFITGPVVREWGFHCLRQWVPWREFIEKTDTTSVTGRGCGEHGTTT